MQMPIIIWEMLFNLMAININPNYAEAYNNLGSALRGKLELNDSIDSYKQALKIDPNYSEAYLNMNNTLKMIELEGEREKFDKPKNT